MQTQDSNLLENAEKSANSIESQEPMQDIAEPQLETRVEVQPAVIALDTTTIASDASQKPEEGQEGIEPKAKSVAPQLPQSNGNEMEARQSSPEKELSLDQEQEKESQENVVVNEQKKEASDMLDEGLNASAPTEKIKKEPPPVPAKPNKSPKKAKKIKKQAEPISETAIPLPAPGQIN
jgi:hypothetical protein